ncbi:hypothetical protein KKC91_12935 [bacterium]|nr:hypothetical protein [bacterium]
MPGAIDQVVITLDVGQVGEKFDESALLEIQRNQAALTATSSTVGVGRVLIVASPTTVMSEFGHIQMIAGAASVRSTILLIIGRNAGARDHALVVPDGLFSSLRTPVIWVADEIGVFYEPPSLSADQIAVGEDTSRTEVLMDALATPEVFDKVREVVGQWRRPLTVGMEAIRVGSSYTVNIAAADRYVAETIVGDGATVGFDDVVSDRWLLERFPECDPENRFFITGGILRPLIDEADDRIEIVEDLTADLVENRPAWAFDPEELKGTIRDAVGALAHLKESLKNAVAGVDASKANTVSDALHYLGITDPFGEFDDQAAALDAAQAIQDQSLAHLEDGKPLLAVASRVLKLAAQGTPLAPKQAAALIESALPDKQLAAMEATEPPPVEFWHPMSLLAVFLAAVASGTWDFHWPIAWGAPIAFFLAFVLGTALSRFLPRHADNTSYAFPTEIYGAGPLLIALAVGLPIGLLIGAGLRPPIPVSCALVLPATALILAGHHIEWRRWRIRWQRSLDECDLKGSRTRLIDSARLLIYENWVLGDQRRRFRQYALNLAASLAAAAEAVSPDAGPGSPEPAAPVLEIVEVLWSDYAAIVRQVIDSSRANALGARDDGMAEHVKEATKDRVDTYRRHLASRGLLVDPPLGRKERSDKRSGLIQHLWRTAASDVRPLLAMSRNDPMTHLVRPQDLQILDIGDGMTDPIMFGPAEAAALVEDQPALSVTLVRSPHIAGALRFIRLREGTFGKE